MSVYRPKDSKVYLFDFQFKGTRFYGSTGTRSKTEAEEYETAEKAKAARDYFHGTGKPERPEMTLDIAADRYYSYAGANPTTKYQLANLIRLIGKDTFLSQITDASIAAFVAKRRGEKNTRYKDQKKAPLVSPSTVNREVELARRVIRRARKVWKVKVDEIDWGEHLLSEPDERVRSLTEREEAALFDDLREDYFPLIAFAIMTGLRLKNLITLTWANVDFTEGRLNIKVKSRKEGGKNHSVPLTADALAFLQELVGQHPIYPFTYICRRNRGSRNPAQRKIRGERYPFSVSGWRKDWAKALEAAKIYDFRFHDLRHTTATRLLKQSGNLRLVQRLLGHESIQTTTKYAHVSDDDLREAMAQLPKYSRSPKTNLKKTAG